MTSNKNFWDTRWQNQNTGWDLGEVSPAIKNYIDQLENKELKVLIPGAGNAYEAEYLISQGFTNITIIDIAPTLIAQLKEKHKDTEVLILIEGDFFEHQGQYDLIIEQTFFCAIDPSLRDAYIDKMYKLLKPKGKLVGVLFNRDFEGGPPFGGSKQEYEKRLKKKFTIHKLEECYCSYPARQDAELWMCVSPMGS